MRNLWIGLVLAAIMGTATADDAAPPIEQQLTVPADAAKALSELKSNPFVLRARRYAGNGASEAAYRRLDAALTDLAKSRGLPVANDGTASYVVEVDSTFYVYTSKFNARLVRLADYTDAQMAGTADKVATAQQPLDALRIAAGALGIVRGWISPSFGSYMIAGGAAPVLFGSGEAPRRLFVAGRERYERGEQEVNTKLRVLKDGTVLATASVRHWTRGDEPPFRIDELVTANWDEVLRQLGADASRAGAEGGKPVP